MKTIKSKNYFLFVFVLFVYSNNVHAKSFWASFCGTSVFRGWAVCCHSITRPIVCPIKAFNRILFYHFGWVDRTVLDREKIDLMDNLQNNTKRVQQSLQEYITDKQNKLIEKINQIDKEFRGALQDSRNYAAIQFDYTQQDVTELNKQITKNNQAFQRRFDEGEAHFKNQLGEVQEANKKGLNGLQQQFEQHDSKVNNFITLINDNINATRNDFEIMRDQVEGLEKPFTDQQRRQIEFALALKNNDLNLLNKHRAAGALAITLSSQK